MYDPFGLVKREPENFVLKGQSQTAPPKKYLWKVVAMIAAIIVLAGGLIYLISFTVSANPTDTAGNASAEVKFSGLPQEVSSSEEFAATLTITNKSKTKIESGYVLVEGFGVNLVPTLSAAKVQNSNEPGYLREATSEETAKFDGNSDGGYYWYVGDIAAGSSGTNQIKAVVSASGTTVVKIEAKYFVPKAATSSCGFLNLSKCEDKNENEQVAFGAASLLLSDQSKIKLRTGYNFITLPYVFTSQAAKTFLSAVGSKWAYYFDPVTAGYIDLNSGDNASKIKPGAGFWVRSNSDKDYDLPNPKVETNINDNFSVPLSIGWNHIGNPYPKRIVWSADKILVQEVTDEGQETGTAYSLKSAMDNQIISKAYVISYKDSSVLEGTTSLTSLIEYKILPTGSYLNSTVGVALESTKKVNLVFPGKSIIAPGDLLTDAEKKKIEEWIIQNGLNQFGDPADTSYSAGTPLIDTVTGQPIDRYDYIVERHVDRPWNK